MSLSLLLLTGLRFTLLTVNTSSLFQLTVRTTVHQQLELSYDFGTVRCNCTSGTLIVVTEVALVLSSVVWQQLRQVARPYANASISFSICAYQDSVSVRTRLVNAIGRPSCNNVDPIPCSDASFSSINGLFAS